MQDGNTQNTSVELTDRAARRIAEICDVEGNAALMLRLEVLGGGCSGFQYGFQFEDAAAGDDLEFDHSGVRVVVDPMSLQYLGGAEVDFIDDLQGSRFVVNNPNAATTCGCGSSFTL